ncbi:VOC family protein [Temperatibacter marinus]|uniref:VOC family protein n=1 Tax=Temperatibacter marinus TaxID=1456591 RepID=A0AA52EKJ8_9PROT|nr:VOC family protein [Temperatibacter marinus]WND03716.1 VOC family protein [Temperatibacter marinus]
MVRLEHVNFVVKNMEKTLDFYQAAFPHWQVRTTGEAEWYGVPRTWLHFGDDVTYLAFNSPGKGVPRDLKTLSVGLMHIAFEVTGLHSLIQRLIDAGYPVDSDGSHTEYRRNVYFIDPDGVEVEFVEYLTDDPRLRNGE